MSDKSTVDMGFSSGLNDADFILRMVKYARLRREGAGSVPSVSPDEWCRFQRIARELGMTVPEVCQAVREQHPEKIS